MYTSCLIGISIQMSTGANTDIWGQIRIFALRANNQHWLSAISLTWNGIISSNVYVVSNRNFHSNVNVLGRFCKQFLTSLYRSTLFGIFLKPDSKQKYLKYDLMHIFMHHLSLYFDSKVYNLWDHCADTGSWIRGQIRIFASPVGQIFIFVIYQFKDLFCNIKVNAWKRSM
jgi:hypothetical protein